MLAVCVLIVGGACGGEESLSPGFKAQRERMVREQIEARGIKDPQILRALRKVERHLFVPEAYRLQAYMDYPLPIGEGQTISQPYIVAFMSEVLALDRSKKILEIGTGSGYQAAVLAEVCHSVYTIEIIESLGKTAMALLSQLGYSNVHVKIGDGYQGWKAFSPFDGIIVTCAPSHIPEPLKEQLAEDGKMVIPVGGRQIQELVLLVKEKGRVRQQSILPVRFVPMLKEGGGTY
jgi:protein-L-isoaspartate(D-aspartate) O-methyltransferase